MSAFDIYWTKNAQDRLWFFVQSIKQEIGGFGYARKISDREIVVDDVWLAPQWVTASEVDFVDGDGVAYAIEKASNDGRLDEADFVWVSWHSHNTMKTFWSGTDEKCIETYGESGVTRLLSIVGNHSMEYRQRLDFFGVDFEGFKLPQVTFDNLDLMDDLTDPAFDCFAEWAREVKNAIREKPKVQAEPATATKVSTWTGSGWSGAAKTLPPAVSTVDEAPNTRDSTAYRPVGESGQPEYFFPGKGWLSQDECSGPKFDETEFEYDSEELELGHAVALAVHKGEVKDIDELSPEERDALIAYYDVLGDCTSVQALH